MISLPIKALAVAAALVASSTAYPDALSSLDGTNGFRVGAAPGTGLGTDLVNIGDVNGDGIDDLAVAAEDDRGRAGSLVVLFGGTNIDVANFNATTDLTTSEGFRISGLAAGDRLGASVCGIGDVNGDTYPDFLVGAPGSNTARGAAWVIYGVSSSGSFPLNVDLSSLAIADGFSIQGEAGTGIEFGAACAAGADLNDDAIGDFCVGAPGSDGGLGTVYCLYGKNADWALVADVATYTTVSTGFTLSGDAAGSATDVGFGQTLQLGDVNDDGRPDLVASAALASTFQGVVYVYFGRASWPLTIDFTTLVADDRVALTGTSVSLAGSSLGIADVDADGKDDLIIGAPSSTVGRAYVVYGKSTWPSTDALGTMTASEAYVVNGVGATAVAGVSVSREAGDLSGDGIDDFLIGVPLKNVANGFAELMTGQASRPAATTTASAAYTAEMDVPASAVAPYQGVVIMDFNGDGKLDVVVSSKLASQGGDDAGGVWVAYGDTDPGTYSPGGAASSVSIAASAVLAVAATVAVMA